MPRTSDEDKRKKEDRVLLHIKKHTNGVTESEIADHFGWNRRTVNNYLRNLENRCEIYKDDVHWYALNETRHLRPLDVEAEEAMALYLAGRLLVKQSDRRNASIETAIEKLGHVLSGDTGIGDDLHRTAQELRLRPLREGYQDVFRAVMRAYLYRRVLEITYVPYSGKPFETTFAPYLLEPSAIGFATYAIGHSAQVDDLRTYKIGRIESARLTRDTYFVPPGFDGLALLRTAWSIYYGEQTLPVVLRFSPDVARRIEETHWHPSQQLEADGDALLMRVEVADFTDLVPWIRGWGAACEVLEPAQLRDQMIGEARQLATMYGVAGQDSDPHQRFDDIFGV